MSVLRGRVAPALLIATVLLAGSALGSYAANGGPMLIGETNKANGGTTLQNHDNGAALILKSRAGEPALKVNHRVKVHRLNADLLDGMNSSELTAHAHRYQPPTVNDADNIHLSFPGLPPGLYVASYALAATMSTAGAKLHCYFDVPGVADLGFGYGATQATFSTATATTVVDTRSAGVKLTCFTEGGDATISATAGGSSVTFLNLDSVTTANATTPPVTRQGR